MTYRIHDGLSEESIVISAETIEELREQALIEVARRGWRDCWSEEVSHESNQT